MSDREGEASKVKDSQTLMPSFTEQWVGKHHGGRPQICSSIIFERLLISVILLVVMCVLILWGVIVYQNMRRNYESNLNEINYLKVEYAKILDKSKENASKYAKLVQTTTRTRTVRTIHKQKSSIALILCGKGVLFESDPGTPIHNWDETAHNGDIEFEKEIFIRIKKDGFYKIEAQMYFYGNEKYFKRKNVTTVGATLDFFIKKGRTKQLVSAVVPLESCKLQCTRAISRIMKLEKGDQLSVQSLSGSRFKMSSDKTHFAAYAL